MNYNIFKSLDTNYIAKLFTQKKDKFFPQFKNEKINHIIMKKTSPDWAKDTCLVEYKINFSHRQSAKIRGTASTKRSKINAWQVMNYVYNYHLNQGLSNIARPIFLDRQNNILFYEEVPGILLADLMNRNEAKKLNKLLPSISKWLAKLHQLRIKPADKIKKSFYPKAEGYQLLFSQIKHFFPELDNEIKKINNLNLIDQIWNSKKTLIHGDFYPGNIIINNNNFFVIDFDKSGIGYPLMDLATLYASFEFPADIWKTKIGLKDQKHYQKILIENYSHFAEIDLERVKNELKIILAKIFLDLTRYFFLFDRLNIDSMKLKDKKILINKLKSLINKAENYLN